MSITLDGTSGITTPDINYTTPFPVSDGGTGLSSITAGHILVGAGTANLTTLAPGAAGNTIVSTGTSWESTLQPRLTQMTEQTASSNTSFDFTSIPSWVVRITISLASISTTGNTYPKIQLGSSLGISTSGYAGSGTIISSGVASLNDTTGFIIYDNGPSSAESISGSLILTRVSGNTWVANGVFANETVAQTRLCSGYKTLVNTLDRVRITIDGSDAFDSGTVNLMYE